MKRMGKKLEKPPPFKGQARGRRHPPWSEERGPSPEGQGRGGVGRRLSMEGNG